VRTAPCNHPAKGAPQRDGVRKSDYIGILVAVVTLGALVVPYMVDVGPLIIA
jgi:hypothetical protein